MSNEPIGGDLNRMLGEYKHDDCLTCGTKVPERPLSVGERGLCNGVESCQHGIAWNNGCPKCAADIVTSLCDEYGIEPHEVVDFVQRDHSIVMAFDSLVAERERDLTAAGDALASAVEALFRTTRAEPSTWASRGLSEAVVAWRAVR